MDEIENALYLLLFIIKYINFHVQKSTFEIRQFIPILSIVVLFERK